ncbi:hypothetical protein GCM10010278_35970 [Streptomyces melanogenes]|nr:hypothetical protein GCM10010278_35970 [Streptomyces melanogenes]
MLIGLDESALPPGVRATPCDWGSGTRAPVAVLARRCGVAVRTGVVIRWQLATVKDRLSIGGAWIGACRGTTCRAPKGKRGLARRRAGAPEGISGVGREMVAGDTALRCALLGRWRAWCGDRELELGSPQQRALSAAFLTGAVCSPRGPNPSRRSRYHARPALR